MYGSSACTKTKFIGMTCGYPLISIDAILPTGWLWRNSMIFFLDCISSFLVSCIYWPFYKNNIIKFFKGKTNVTTPTKDVVDQAQDQATEVIDTAEQKIDTAEQTKTQVIKRIHKKKKKIQDLEDKKKNVPVVDRTLSEAKQNIIKKTKRK